MARAYSHQGHGPRADQTGRIHISDFRYPANSLLRNAAGPYIWVNRVDLAASAVCPVIGPFKSWWFAIEGVGPNVIQAPKLELRIMRTELSDHEWVVIKPMLPNKPRGLPRVNDRRVLNGIFWVLRSGAPWRDLPESFGPPTTCYNRFVRWRRAGVWDRIMEALAEAQDAAVQMIDTSIVRVHQHGACIAANRAQHTGR